MNTVLLLSVILGVSLQNIFKKAFGNNVQGGTFIFSAISSLFAGMVFLVIGIKNFSFEKEMLVYSVFFAISYATGVVFSFFAIITGSLALTSLFTSYSLIIPTFWGIFFLNEPMSQNLVWGILFLCISIMLVNLKSAEERKEAVKSKFSLKWWIYVFLAFLGNGMCSTVQKLEQVAFDGAGKNEFMVVALILVFVAMYAISLKFEKENAVQCMKKGLPFMALCGIVNGLVNLFVMILSNSLPACVMFPLISAGGIISTALISVFFYKETLNKYQIKGLFLGIVSVVLLSL